MSAPIVIIGGSHAAAQAIMSLRVGGWEHGITLVEAETELPYQRPPLSKKYLLGEVSVEQMRLKPESFYADAGVELIMGQQAQRIDRAQRHLELSSGDQLPYEKLILATGTRPRTLPLPGSDEANLAYLRTLRDARGIGDGLLPDTHLLVIGAGYIGLELAASAVKRGCKVTVLEAQDRVLARVTSPVVSQFYQRLHGDAGVDIRLDTALTGFAAREDKIDVLAEGGEVITANQVVVGIGVIPNTELAEEAGLDCENGVVVNEFTQTNDPAIFAIGDCANYPSTRLGRRLRLESVPNAVGQAKTAAAAICGNPVPYDDVPWFWSDQYDIKLQTVGLWDAHDALAVRGHPDENKFAVFYLCEGRLIALDAINSPAEFMVAKKLIAAEASPDPAALEDVDVPLKSLL
ncbi:MAG: FAD-dependent oxidoreductase [Pseudomonadota bacterium]